MSSRSNRRDGRLPQGATGPLRPTGLQFSLVYLLTLLLLALALVRWRDPTWTYVFFWRFGFLEFQGWAATTSLLTPSVPLALWSCASWTALWFVLRRYEPLQVFLSRHLRATMTLLAGTFIGAVLLIGLLEGGRYRLAQSQMNALHVVIDRLGSITATRPLKPPFDFVYLDVPGMDAMYAQLEPALREKQRTVEKGGQISADAKLNTEAASVGISANRREVETSHLQAIDPSAQRRGSDVIMMLVEQKRLPVYKDSGAWIMARLMVPVQEAVSGMEDAWRHGHLKEQTVVSASANEKDSKQRVAEMTDEMKLEFDNLRGQVVIEGPWRQASSKSGVTRLEHDFYPAEPGKPAPPVPVDKAPNTEPVVFAINVPERSLPRVESQDFRVFGTILSSAHGRFEIKVLAAFY